MDVGGWSAFFKPRARTLNVVTALMDTPPAAAYTSGLLTDNKGASNTHVCTWFVVVVVVLP